ncbi:hypothetical protein TcYC6_0008260 [Trypanosoma cruzi]|nr:hypothetical protein TcYC6_0008260 [Trypanosoma cruzi]
MHSRDRELGAVCHVANAVHTCSNCAASRTTKEEGATVASTMNVTAHKYAGPYELWRRQFSPDGTIHPPARSGDADQTGICQLPPPREGKDDTKSGGTTAPQVNAEFATNPNEMMVPIAFNKRLFFAYGLKILVASNGSGIMSVTYGGREHVAAVNTYEVNEHNATGHKISRFRKWRCRQWICC